MFEEFAVLCLPEYLEGCNVINMPSVRTLEYDDSNCDQMGTG